MRARTTIRMTAARTPGQSRARRMIKTLLDKNADASLRVLVSTCLIAIGITLVYSVWRIQLATVTIRISNQTIREIRDYAVRRDAEIFPLVHEIRGDVKNA